MTAAGRTTHKKDIPWTHSPTHRPGRATGPAQCRYRPNHSEAVPENHQAHRSSGRLFYDWRRRKDGSQDPEFFLNQPRYQQASILLTRDNFGCGSSREHAPGRCSTRDSDVFSPQLRRHFLQQLLQNGILPVVLKLAEIQALFEGVAAQDGYTLTVDLAAQQVKHLRAWPITSTSIRSERTVCIADWTQSADAPARSANRRI